MSDSQTRVLFLVAKPLRDSLDWVLCKLQTATPSTAPSIDWHNKSGSASSLPRISDHLCFARHLAVGMIDRKDREDPALAHLQRFASVRFWEHLGSSNKPRNAGTLGVKDILSIEVVEFLGWTDKSDKTIANECMSHILEQFSLEHRDI